MNYKSVELLKEEVKELNNENINFYVELLEELAKKESVEVVFSGTLSNGKSTVVNAILGENLLQTGIGSTTAKITYISKGEKDKIIGITKDGKEIEKELNRENIKSVNEDKNIELVKIKKSNFKFQNITFVDSPGINDLNKFRENISYAYVPLADVVVFVLDIAKGITADEKKFFDDKITQTHKDKIFILLNGLDKVEGEDLSPILDNPIIEGYKLFPLSAKQYLIGILKDDKEKIEKSNFLPFLKEFNSYIESIDSYKIINERIDNSLNSVKELANLQINSMIENLSKTKEEIDKELNIQKELLIEEEKKVKEAQEKLEKDINDIKEYVKNGIDDIKRNVSQIEDKEEAIDYIKSKIDDIVSYTKNELRAVEIDLGMAGFIHNITKYFDQIIAGIFNIFGKGMPTNTKFISKIPILKQILGYADDFVFERKLPEILDNIDSHFNQEIGRIYKEKSQELEYLTLSPIKTKILSLESALKQKEKNREEIEREIKRLNEKLKNISEIQ